MLIFCSILNLVARMNTWNFQLIKKYNLNVLLVQINNFLGPEIELGLKFRSKFAISQSRRCDINGSYDKNRGSSAFPNEDKCAAAGVVGGAGKGSETLT